MMHPLTPRRPSRPVTKINRLGLVIGLLILGSLVGGVMLLQVAWQHTPTAAAKETPQEQHLKLPEVITRTLPTREPAVIIRPAVAPEQATLVAPPQAQAPSVQQQNILDTLNPLSGTPIPPKASETPHGEHPPGRPAVSVPPAPTPAAPAKKGWEVLARGKRIENEAPKTPVVSTDPIETQALAALRPGFPVRPPETPKGAQEAQTLIRPARWAIPQSPLRTIYRSQTLTGRLLQPVNSDIPGQVKLQLTTPVLDKFGYDTTILPKDTLVIASQEGRPQYGTARLALTLEQLELPSGEVIALQAMVGDEAGTHGMAGKVNNHFGKIILATGLSAFLNIGVRSATGTPGAGQFFQNPIQQAGQDIGQAVQRDAQSIIDRELRIPPTITIPAGTFCTVSLLENIQLNHPPMVAR